MPSFNLEGIRFVDLEPRHVPEEHWEPLWEVNLRAFSRGLAKSRSQSEINTYVGTLEHFRETSLDLKTLLEGGIYNRGQAYDRQRMIIAYADARPVGFLRVADNVSGETEEIRRQKAEGRWRNYRTLNLEAVDPYYQGRGIGLGLEFAGLATARHRQRATAWTFPQELPRGDAMVRQLGGRPMGGPTPKPYMGPEARPLVQQGYRITTARWAARKLLLHPSTGVVAREVAHQLRSPARP